MPLHHSPANAESEPASPRRARLGLWLFALYLALYVGFVLLNAIAPDRMEATPWAGLNVAILYGLNLIFAAFTLSLVYEFACRRIDRTDAECGERAR